MARPMHTPESAVAAAIARRWAAPWKATCELLTAAEYDWRCLNNAARTHYDILQEWKLDHAIAYRAALSAGIPPRVIARRDLDDPRISDSVRRQAIVNALGAGPRRRGTISTFPHNDPQGESK